MKKDFKIVASLLFLALLSNSVYAGSYIYRFKDKDGHYVYTDNLPAGEKGAYTVLSGRTGTIKEVVDRELTPDEVSKKETKQVEDKKIVEQNDMQKKKDVALLSTYSNVDDIDKMRSYELGQIDQVIKSGVDVTANLKDRLNQVEANQKSSPNSKKLQEDHDKISEDLKTASENLEANKNLYAQRTKKYDDDKSRYLEILQQMASKPGASAPVATN